MCKTYSLRVYARWFAQLLTLNMKGLRLSETTTRRRQRWHNTFNEKLLLLLCMTVCTVLHTAIPRTRHIMQLCVHMIWGAVFGFTTNIRTIRNVYYMYTTKLIPRAFGEKERKALAVIHFYDSNHFKSICKENSRQPEISW